MIKENYHTHTYRCSHAIGTDEEYVQEAIAFGLTELGFSDHIFLPDHPQPGIRGDYSLLDDYINSIEALREKYKDRIKIYLGFEAEALPYYYDYYKKLLDEGHIQYLVLGNHCEIDKNNNLRWYFSRTTTKQDVKRYTSSLIKGVKTGLFKIVAHPDYFMASYTKWDSFTARCARRICRVCKRYDVPLEVNFGSLRNGKKLLGKEYRFSYPHKEFFKIVKKMGCKVCVGIDAHSPQDFVNVNNDEGFKFIKELGLTLSQKINIK